MSHELFGYPTRGQRETGIPVAGVKVDFYPEGTTAQLHIRNSGSEILRVFFSQEDFDADANYYTLGVASETERRSPVFWYRGCSIWLKAVANTTDAEIVHSRTRS
jgi:hypothetical protein